MLFLAIILWMKYISTDVTEIKVSPDDLSGNNELQGNSNVQNDNTQQSDNEPSGPYERGGMPLMSDSVFSLIILIYVSVAFLFVFFMFCWRNGNGRAAGTLAGMGTNGNLKCPLMSLEDIIGGKQQQEKSQSIMMNTLNENIEEDFNRR